MAAPIKLEIKLQDPDEEVKPRVFEDDIPELIDRLYGLKVIKIKALPGYDDLNFFVLAADDKFENNNIKSVHKDGYVLKVLNSLQSSSPEIIDAQHALCKYVRDRGVATQVQIQNKQGQDWSLETFQSKDKESPSKNGPYLVRLLTYVPGKIFHQTPYIPGSFYNIGLFVGKLHKAMVGFHHSLYDTYTLIWSLEKAPVLKDFLKAVNCEGDVAIVKEVLQDFEENVVPNYDKFTRGVIHGDINDQNAIMREIPGQEKLPPSERVHDVSAMLDFNDVTDSYIVFDVAICIAYFSIVCPVERQTDVGGHILAGYYKTCSLNEHEFEALKTLICTRLCQTLVYGAHSYAQQPLNTYVLTTAKGGWPLLRKLWRIPAKDLYTRWEKLIQEY